MKIESFLQKFVSFSDKIPPSFGGISEKEFFYELRICNALKTDATVNMLKFFFGGLSVLVEQIDGTQDLSILVSKVDVPDSYLAFDVLNFLEQNKNLGWFMGIGPFGPEFFHLNDLTHGLVLGSSGYGKSNFFRFLISQTLAFQDDVVNFIIDPKQVDFKSFDHHKRVAFVASSQSEWVSMIHSLLIEQGFREHLFSNAFEVPPVSLVEYREFKKKFSREDLPDLPRLLVWVDEAHMLFPELSSYQSSIGPYLEPLIKKGRAFGIHFIFSSQRWSDLPSGIKSQANTLMAFYTPEAHQLPDVISSVAVHNKEVKRGRLSYFNPRSCKISSVQTPLLSSTEALGLALKFNSASQYPKQGLTRLKVRKDWLTKPVLAHRIANGHNLKSLVSAGEKSSSADPRDTSYVNSFLDCYDHFESSSAVKALPPQAPPQGAPVSTAGDESLESLFDRILQENSGQKAESISGSHSNPAVVSTEKSHNLFLEEPRRVDNLPEFESLIQETHQKILSSKPDLKWALRDLSGNLGLRVIQRAHKSGFEVRSVKSSVCLSEMVFSKPINEKLSRYLNELREVDQGNKASLLILSGPKGSGRLTLIEALAAEIGASLKKGSEQDVDEVLFLSRDLELSEGVKTPSKESPKNLKVEKSILYFENDEQAIRFYRHAPAEKIVVLLKDEAPPYRALFGLPSDEVVFKYLDEPHVGITLSANTWSEDSEYEALISSVLQRNLFVGQKQGWAKLFKASGIVSLPSAVWAIAERSRKLALYKNKPFSDECLEMVLSQYRGEKEVQRSQNIEVVKPIKSLSDLITSDSTRRDLEDVIYKAKNLESNRYKFLENLRKSGRMVALFLGPPGTGKSMAAEVVAKETGRDLWVASYDKMVKGMVGATEEILTDIFTAASASHVILLIDEADALLANRESLDEAYLKRWINHLLMLIESFNGVLILTTNHADKMDSALSRRIDIKAHFAEPDEVQMVEIMKRLLQPDAPLSAEFDFAAVVKDIKLSGGLVRNAIERAVLKMERLSLSELSSDFMREVFLETQAENELISKKAREISLR